MPMRWMTKGAKKHEAEVFPNVVDGLKRVYTKAILPLELQYKFHEFHSPVLDDSDFEAKPMVLLVGQYSTGKTTFIKYLLESDYPGMRIGPEPTTDGFLAIMCGDQSGVIPGNAAVVDKKLQFRRLSKFGNAFLNRFSVSQMKNPVLDSLTFVDTPGILSGEKQRINRGYDFTGVLHWFAERVDRIILLFDAHKLDISDEFRAAIDTLRGYDEKIRIVLNKADGVDQQQMMRVYGALMWSLGKVFSTPEVVRVYIGSFWDQPLQHDENRKLFEAEATDLFTDLQSLPRHAALRKLNDLIKRARLAKVHAFIIAALKEQMPSVFKKDSKKADLIKHLDLVYAKLQREHNISLGDFPSVEHMREMLKDHDFTKFPPLDPKKIASLDKMLVEDVANIMAMIPQEEIDQGEKSMVRGGAFAQMEPSPFAQGSGEGIQRGAGETEWVVSKDRSKYDDIFYSLSPIDGKIPGSLAKKQMVLSKLPNPSLAKIWKLSDIDRDGQLDIDEFALAQHLINVKLEGHDIPEKLPEHLIPPSKLGGSGGRDSNGLYPSLDRRTNNSSRTGDSSE